MESSWKLTVDSVLESLEEEPSSSSTRLEFDQWCASLYDTPVRIEHPWSEFLFNNINMHGLNLLAMWNA